MSANSTNAKPPHHPKKSVHHPTQQQQYKKTSFQNQQYSDITKEEFDRIAEALKKEEFRKLFFDYIEEIQDPENRKRYEEEITQIERERGVDVIFIHPEPGFVIKTSQDGNQKCFINCAKSEHIAKPTNEICLDHNTGTRGINWSIPSAQAPPRDDLDNKNKRCSVYDVVFHPDALYLAERNKSFQKCLVDTALDAVEREFKVSLDRVNIKFPKMQFKGIARPTVIRKLAKDPPADCNEPHPLEDIYPPKPTANTSVPKVLPMKTINCSNKSTKNTSSDYCIPKYTIKHRHGVDLSEYTNELDAKLNRTKPRELVVHIELPLLNSSNECQLDVTEKTVFLLSERAGAKYRLNIDLPFKVNDKDGSAKFDTDTRSLTITLPVIQQSIEKQRKIHETLLHLNREDSGVESDMRDELLSNNSESPTEEIAATPIALDLKKACEQNTSKLEEAAITGNIEQEQPFLQSNIEYQLPGKFDCNVLDNTMSWVIHVRNVQEDSVQIKHDNNWLHLKFTSIGSGYYPTYYAFYVKLLENETDAQIVKTDFEAWENNVILNVHLSTNAELIKSYLAGIDSEHQQEYIIQEKFKVSHNSRKRQKKKELASPLSLDISIERSECEKTVEIEIKPRSSEVSTCNTNSTEDEEELKLQYDSSNGDILQPTSNQKKLNKKQKRKNKKRRSLSESACDEIKQYHHQQQQELQKAVIAPITVPEVNETENVEDGDADDDEDSSPDRTEKSHKHLLSTSSSVNVPSVNNINNNKTGTLQQHKQRSFSESRDSVISLSAGSCSYKGILKHYSRYDPRPSVSDSCDSIDEFSSSAYSTPVDAMSSALNSLRFSKSFSDIPEENVAGLSESCKKTVRFSEIIKKQVFRLDSSILGQRKKNQKRRDRKQRKLQRRFSEGDSADYEDNKPITPISTSSGDAHYFKSKNQQNSVNTNKNKALDKKSNKIRARLESESSSDIDNHKNSMMFEMDM